MNNGTKFNQSINYYFIYNVYVCVKHTQSKVIANLQTQCVWGVEVEWAGVYMYVNMCVSSEKEKKIVANISRG